MLTITSAGQRRTTSEDFAEFAQIVAARNGIEDAMLWVGAVLCGDEVGAIHGGSYDDFLWLR